MAVESGLVKRVVHGFLMAETKLGQGRDTVKTMIEDNPELMSELELKIKIYCEE